MLALAALPLAGTTLAGCGTNDPTTPTAYDDTGSDGASDGESGGASDGPSGAPSAGASSGRLRALGESIDVGGLRVTVRAKGVGGDKNGPWLTATMRVENRGDKALGLPILGLECSGSTTSGYAVDDSTSLRPGRTRTIEVSLFITDRRGEEDYYEPIEPCRGTASVSVLVSSGRPDYVLSTSAGWQVDASTLAALNARLPFTRPGGEPKDPDRPYAWAAGDGAFSSGYQVVLVPGITAEQAIRVLKPLRGAPDLDDFERVVVADHGDGVVLFTWALISDEDVTALSRIKGLAATYGNTVNGDDHVLVARRGKVVRSFDPFLDQDYEKTPRLPEEKGLDLEYDTGPASWTLLERLTRMHITEGWLLDDSHPGFRLDQE